MKTIYELKERVCDIIEDNSQWGFDISHEIFTHPENSDDEFYASQYLADVMKQSGFEVEYPYAGIATAFRCSHVRQSESIDAVNVTNAKVAFLAEYDALPGYGPDHSDVAHACGHNWIAASTAMAACALAQMTEVPGEVMLIGTPGEEVSGRKVDMADAGVFDGIDAVFQMHLSNENCVDTVALAMTDFVFEFYGKSAHAAGCPENGINALDACQLTIAGINALRQQLPPEVKIHVTYIDGGGRASVIPEHASLSVYVRDANKDRLEKIIARLLDVGRGAELMTGARFEYTRAANTYYDLNNDVRLQTFMEANLKELGINNLTHGDIYHAVSSDIGNVSYRCPTCYSTISTTHISDAQIHEEAFIDVADSKGAHELLLTAAKAMAMSAIDVLLQNGK